MHTCVVYIIYFPEYIFIVLVMSYARGRVVSRTTQPVEMEHNPTRRNGNITPCCGLSAKHRPVQEKKPNIEDAYAGAFMAGADFVPPKKSSHEPLIKFVGKRSRLKEKARIEQWYYFVILSYFLFIAGGRDDCFRRYDPRFCRFRVVSNDCSSLSSSPPLPLAVALTIDSRERRWWLVVIAT